MFIDGCPADRLLFVPELVLGALLDAAEHLQRLFHDFWADPVAGCEKDSKRPHRVRILGSPALSVQDSPVIDAIAAV
jgi:hypothetical protein